MSGVFSLIIIGGYNLIRLYRESDSFLDHSAMLAYVVFTDRNIITIDVDSVIPVVSLPFDVFDSVLDPRHHTTAPRTAARQKRKTEIQEKCDCNVERTFLQIDFNLSQIENARKRYDSEIDEQS